MKNYKSTGLVVTADIMKLMGEKLIDAFFGMTVLKVG